MVDGRERPAADRTGDATVEPLSRMVRQEAHRVMSEAQLSPDPARLADGWERRFIADGDRADEAIRLYQELGFEVAADPITQEQMGGDCTDCQLLMLLKFRTIYTRRR